MVKIFFNNQNQTFLKRIAQHAIENRAWNLALLSNQYYVSAIISETLNIIIIIVLYQ